MLNWQPKKPTLSPNWKRLILRLHFAGIFYALNPKAHKKQAVAVGPLRSAPGAEQTQ